MSSRRALTALVLTIPLLALIAVCLLMLSGLGQRAGAFQVEPGLDFSISSTSGGQNCDSSGTPTNTCTFPVGATFTLDFNLNALSTNLQTGGYGGYDMLLSEHNVTIVEASLNQHGADMWPDCAYAAHDFAEEPFPVTAGCSVGIGANGSTYTGLLMQVDFQCSSTDTVGSLTLVPQNASALLGGDTALLSPDLTIVYEEAASESLTINCGTPSSPTPTATRTPGGATDTPAAAPTDTPTPAVTNTPLSTPTMTPTRTPRPNHVLLGDVDGDLTVNSLDALWVLWFAAGIVVDVPLPDAADVDGDNVVNATDALYILWVEADQVTIL